MLVSNVMMEISTIMMSVQIHVGMLDAVMELSGLELNNAMMQILSTLMIAVTLVKMQDVEMA